jgi:hypothetical protein
MTSINVAVSVPVDDRAELEELRQHLQSDAPAFESRALDGETVVTILLALSTVALPYFEAWLNARVAAKKGTSVRDGEFRVDGYSAKDALLIMDRLHGKLNAEDSDD